MLEMVVNRISEGRSTTVAIVRIDDEDLTVKADFQNPPDIKTAKLIRRALDQYEEEAREI